ncbi:MAG: NADH-quinone oxidoreductase subunit N [Planctomycetota bacterium]
MNEMAKDLTLLGPEIAMLTGALACLVAGLANPESGRKAAPWLTAAALFSAMVLSLDWHGDDIDVGPIDGPVLFSYGIQDFAGYIKLAVCLVGFVLLMVAAAVPSQLGQVLAVDEDDAFDPGQSLRGEFFAFFLFSLTGVMLCAGANDLVWLFLALELTSLPTYVMVAVSRERPGAQESAVKYFFLGALSAAVFLYGFTLIYGATGFTDFAGIRAAVVEQVDQTGSISMMMLVGVVLSILGIAFKIAAFPMHFYAADVYKGASTAVTAFIAFVPKTAGFVALLSILSLVAWHPAADGQALTLPGPIFHLIWWMAVLTMTMGNVLGLVQRSVKRTLAYSSIAHSGYMLIGLLVGPSLVAHTGPGSEGVSAILFYLVGYAFGTIGSFAVIGCLRDRGEEADDFEDLSGLAEKYPWLAWIMLLSVFSLLGMPPFVGFVGKVYLFGAAFDAGLWLLVVIGVVNSAISAGYYLRIAGACFFGKPHPRVERVLWPGRRLGAGIAAFATLFLGIFGSWLIDAAQSGTLPEVGSATPTEAQVQPAEPAEPSARIDASAAPAPQARR